MSRGERKSEEIGKWILDEIVARGGEGVVDCKVAYGQVVC